MAAQIIEKAVFDAYFEQMLIEKRDYFKELIKEVIDEKLISVKSNKEASNVNGSIQDFVPPTETRLDAQDPFALEQLMPHFDKILKEDHHLLLRLAQ